MTKANANMGDSHQSEKTNNAQSKRSTTTPSGGSSGPPKMINKGEGLTNSGATR